MNEALRRDSRDKQECFEIGEASQLPFLLASLRAGPPALNRKDILRRGLGETRLTWCIYRTSSQKPGDELYANFRQHFPQIATTMSTGGSNVGSTTIDEASVDVAVLESYVYSRIRGAASDAWPRRRTL